VGDVRVYDFTFQYSAALNGPSLGGPSDPAPYLVDAVRDQLGLDLKETRISLDIVVVDRMDRTPGEN
jgi:uncharacterized protein (TIGR03435 family)